MIPRFDPLTLRWEVQANPAVLATFETKQEADEFIRDFVTDLYECEFCGEWTDRLHEVSSCDPSVGSHEKIRVCGRCAEGARAGCGRCG